MFSAKAEYACVAMLELAARHGDPQPVRLKTIADANGIPQRFLVQILLQLKGAGLVASVRGAAGGYQLAKLPTTISLATILNTIDRPEPAEPARSRTDGKPPSALARSLHLVWRDLQSAQRRLLEKTTLAELVERSRDAHELSYQI